MEINGHVILEDTRDILIELRKQLDINGIKRFDKLIQSGDNLQTNCPFHKNGQERKPSFGINIKTGECHCFGCGWAGTFSEMISNCFGKDDFGVYGDKWLVKNFLSVQVESREDIELNFDRHTKPSKVGRDNLDSRGCNIIVRDNYISEEELDSYRYIHPYMYKRRLTDEIIEIFDIGYDKNTKCITFPVRDIYGNTLFVARRSVNSKFFNYPSGAEKPVYGLYELKEMSTYESETLDGVKTTVTNYPQEVIICESMIDALTCWVYGKYAVALNGLGNDLQYKQLNNMPCRKFILATDMDEAGTRARQRLKQKLSNKIVTEYVWDINIAKDINDMSKEYFDSLREMF